METNQKTTEISATRILGLLTLLVSLYALLSLVISTPDSDPITAWTLLILFGIPALIYIAVCIRSIVRGGAKYLIFRERKISTKPKKEEIDEAEQERQAIRERELKRTEKEKYSTPMLKTRWTAMPLLMLFGAGLYAAIVYFSNEKDYPMDGFNIAILIIGALGMLDIWGISLQDDWEKIRRIKWELNQENSGYQFSEGYDDDRVYTDSKFSYLFFRFGKALAYILGAAGLAILAGIGIYLVSGISLSPTSIIIFLLIMIYFKIGEKNNQ